MRLHPPTIVSLAVFPKTAPLLGLPVSPRVNVAHGSGVRYEWYAELPEVPLNTNTNTNANANTNTNGKGKDTEPSCSDSEDTTNDIHTINDMLSLVELSDSDANVCRYV